MTAAIANANSRKNLMGPLSIILLLLLMSWSSSISPYNELSEDVSPSYITSNNAVTADTAINKSAPNNGYSTQQSIMIFSSDEFNFDSRGLFDFNISDTSGNPLPTSFRITSAHLVLRCNQETSFGSGRTMFYAASLDAPHNMSQATWNTSSTGVNWSSPGADGSSDRGIWEPSYISSSTTVSTAINVTTLVQSSLRSNSNQISFVVSVLGVPVLCETMESSTSSNRPNLRIEYAAIGSIDEGSVNITSPQDGEALTLPDTLALTSDTTPTITWDELNGSNVEVQISDDSSFRTIVDGEWVWDSWNDASAFSFSNSTIGSFETPTTNLSEGSEYFARIRSSTSQSILSDWESVRFLLPDHNVIAYNGVQYFAVHNNSMGFGGTIEDTYVTSGNTNFNGGSENDLIVGHSNTTGVGTGVMLLRINIADIGLHENASIHEADLVLRRTDRERWPVISVSELSDDEWTQHGANWTSNGAGTTWTNGGADLAGTSFGAVNGNQQQPQLYFDIAPIFRDRLLANSTEPINLIVQGAGPNGAHVEIGSSEEVGSYNPTISLGYSWGDDVIPSSPVDLSPRDRSGSWDISGANLTSSDTVVVSWNTTGHTGHDVIIKASTDADFRTTVTRYADSRTDSGFDLAAGTFTFPSSWSIGIGDHVWWRISFIEDGDRSYWSDSMMYLPNLNSTYLSGNEHQMRLSDGNASASSSQVLAVPECEDTYLSSTSTSSNNDDGYLVISSTDVSLFKCDMAGLILPEGMAIQSAVLRTYAWTFTTFNNVPINVYSGTSDWNEDNSTGTGATWDTRDGSRPWASAGASGTDRISLLDTQTVSTTGTGDWFEWNITSAAQSANRWGTPISIIMTSTSGTSAEFQDSETGGTGPEIVITYGIGDDTSPDIPIGLNPTGDEWMVSDDLLMQGIVRPIHTWTTPLLNTNGIELQIDEDPSMSTSNLETYQSWVDTSAFDITNGTFTPPSDLTEGKRHYWRMRGISSSGQVGNWSATSSYVIPDVVSSMLDSSTSEVEMHHHGFLPGDHVPDFFDTYIDERSAYENTSYASSTSLTLFSPPDIPSGNIDISANFSNDRGALFKIPIDENLTLPHPNDIRIVGTELHFNVISGQGTGVRVYVAAVDPFNESATGRTMDGSTNWSSPHTFGNDNISIHDGVSLEVTSSGSNSINITRIMQLAADRGDDFLYLALTAAQDSYTSSWNGISLSSVDSSVATERPYLSIQFRNGSAPVPNGTGTPDSPSNGELIWTTNGIVFEPDVQPTLEWLTPTGWNTTWDWSLSIACRDSTTSFDAIFDSRSNSGFDLTGPSFTLPSSSSIVEDSSCAWRVQSIVDDMLGPISGSEIFGVPNDITNSISSTEESVTAQKGIVHTAFNMYDLVEDAEIRSNAQNNNYGQSNSMYVGRSGYGLVSIDLSLIPIPEPWMSTDARLDLYKMSSTSGNHEIAVYNVFEDWDESNVNWVNSSSGNPWSAQSGYLENTMSPIGITTVNSTYGWYSWDVTAAVQQARIRGDDVVRLLFRDIADPTSSNVYFATSEYSQNTFSPRLNIVYSAGSTWVPGDASSTDPAFGTSSTFWNMTTLLPTPPDSVDLSWSHSLTNHSWDFQVDSNPFFSDSDSFNSVSNSSLFATTTGSGIPSSSTSFTFPSTTSWDDEWYYWRVRGVENGQYGNWTAGGSIRVPSSGLGASDGSGNYTVTLERGDVFETSGALPSFPDTYIDSAGGPGQTQNHGTSQSLNVGASPTAGAVVVSLIEMDLGELPFQSTTLPTGVTLRLHRSNYLGSGTHTVGIHDCGNNTWTEDTVSWSNYIPGQKCSTTASASITRVATGSTTWYEWDITSIARNAFNNQNGRMTMALITNWSGTLYFESAESSSNNPPQLVFDYVDNPTGITPPPQVSLQSPSNLDVLFEENGYLLEPQYRPSLNWAAATGASGYILRLMNESSTYTQRSWIDSGFSTNGLSWTPSFNLDTDTLYSWDIQSIAGSIPGARSASWSFAVGDPDTSSLGNHLYSITYGEGEAANVFQYPNIHDSTIDESDPSEVFADRDLEVGIGCGDTGGTSTTNECRSIVWLDLGQIPLPSNLNPHSGKLKIHLDSVLLADTSFIDVSAHMLLNQNYSEVSSSWDDASYGYAWDTPGMRSGIDYATTPLDTVRIYNTNGNAWFEFDISDAMTSMYGVLGIVLIGTPDTASGRIVVEFDNSEDSTYHPQLILNYTNVYDIQISGPSSTDADTPVTFTATLVDVGGNTLAGDVAWSSSNLGSISSSGVYTPQIAGNETITARFGQVTKNLGLSVDHGAPVTLIPDTTTAALNADQNLSVSAIVVDIFGNEVDGESVLWSVTNGSFTSTGGMTASTSTPSASVVYMPWLTGSQTITVTWGTSSETISVVVSTGAPHHLVVTGCSILTAGTTCTYTWVVEDVRFNQMPALQAGTVSWSVDNGNITSAGEFTGDHVGNWTLTASSSVGVSGSFGVEVTFGAIDHVILVAESTELTADESTGFTVTSVDVRGNTFQFPQADGDWASNNGTFSEDANQNVSWMPWSKGQQWVQVSVSGVISNQVMISVIDGAPVEMDLRVTGGFSQTTAGEILNLRAFVIDQRGNQKPVTPENWLITTPGGNQDWIVVDGASSNFYAYTEGDWTIQAALTWTDGVTTVPLTASETVTVVPGNLADVEIQGSGDYTLTADDSISLTVVAKDMQQNVVQADSLRWYLHDLSVSSPPGECGASLDSDEITTEVESTGSWAAGVEGTYRICAIQNGYQDSINADVSHGVAVRIWHVAEKDLMVAGEMVDVQLYAEDSALNRFEIGESSWDDPLVWDIDNDNTGAYVFMQATVGIYELEYTHNALSEIWTVEVIAANLDYIVLTADKTEAEQQGVLLIYAFGYDEWNNQVPLNDPYIVASGHEYVVTGPQSWEITLIASGASSITVADQGESASVAISSIGTIPGFFAAGGPLYYAAGAMIGLLVLALLLFVVVILRRGGSDDYDDYDDDDDDDDDDDIGGTVAGPSGPAAGPSGPAAGPSEAPAEEVEEQSGDEDGVTVDEDGTEWWEDSDDGTWYFRTPEMDDWEVFEE